MLKSTSELAAIPRKLSVLAFGVVMAFALTGSATGETGSRTEALNRTEILFLGTAGGPPLRLDRSEPSTLLIVDGRPYMIDCGIGTMRRMLQAGIQSEQIKTIFFTHLHSDHALGLADVMANDYFRLRAPRSVPSIHIYGPPQTKEFVDAAFRYITITVRPFASENPSDFHVVNGEFASPFVPHEIDREGIIFQDDKIRVTAVENTHYALMPAEDRKRMKSFSYRIETPHGVIVFTGDTAPSDAVERLAKGADVLLAEVSYRDSEDLEKTVNTMATITHATPERTKTFRAHFQFEHLDAQSVGELASKAQVKSVLLYHYNPADKADAAAYVSGAKSYFSGPVFAPADLDRYCLAPAEKANGDSNALSPCENTAQSQGLAITNAALAGAAQNLLGDEPAKFDQKVEAATLRNDVSFFRAVLSSDVRFRHGTGVVTNKQQWLDSVPQGKFSTRDLDSVEVEPHGDAVETTGHIHIKSSGHRPEYEVWYVRVYARREGRWLLVSNRTVREVDGSGIKK